MKLAKNKKSKFVIYPKRVLLSPWRSSTPRALAKALGLYLRTPGQIVAVPTASERLKLIVNWGTRTGWGHIRTINHSGAVNIASSKLLTLRGLTKAAIPTLDWSMDVEKAAEWLKTSSVICHHNVRAHSAQGLTISKKGSEAADLPETSGMVYTKYFPKKVESRVHVIKTPSGIQTFYLEKKRVSPERYDEFGLEESPTTFIRTYENGWIFARQVQDDKKAIELAVKALKEVDLDFGAVDIMLDGNRYVVGELNTAPGLEGECLDFYVANLKSLL